MKNPGANRDSNNAWQTEYVWPPNHRRTVAYNYSEPISALVAQLNEHWLSTTADTTSNLGDGEVVVVDKNKVVMVFLGVLQVFRRHSTKTLHISPLLSSSSGKIRHILCLLTAEPGVHHCRLLTVCRKMTVMVDSRGFVDLHQWHRSLQQSCLPSISYRYMRYGRLPPDIWYMILNAGEECVECQMVVQAYSGGAVGMQFNSIHRGCTKSLFGLHVSPDMYSYP